MRIRTGEPKLHLHIGRNKAGSTTLQTYFVQQAEALRQAGVLYVLFNMPSPAGSFLPVFPTHRHLADFVRAQPGGAVLVSHEGLCCFTPEMTRIMASDLASLNIQLIFYVRPYGDWAVSSYSFDVRTGFNGRDFDCYLETIRPQISFWPMLEIWGQVIGWDRVRVRSLDPADLHGGDLVTDCLSAIELPAPPLVPLTRGNVSPSWIAIELLRLVVGRDSADGWDPARLAVAEALHELADASMDASGVARTRGVYLTQQQARGLAALYNQDLEAVAAYTGARLQPDNGLGAPARAFLPSAAEIPKDVMRMIRQRALVPDYARVHPEAASFVVSPAFSRLCDA